jgi:hypothetical protein
MRVQRIDVQGGIDVSMTITLLVWEDGIELEYSENQTKRCKPHAFWSIQHAIVCNISGVENNETV